jgi:hypothetical protein
MAGDLAEQLFESGTIVGSHLTTCRVGVGREYLGHAECCSRRKAQIHFTSRGSRCRHGELHVFGYRGGHGPSFAGLHGK